jgi:CMP-N-acetylneuraminic acid synthetase
MINGKTVLAITLARGGSRGIFKKNIAPLNNKPLLTYTIDEVIKSEYIDKYIVATDDDGIEQVCITNKVDCFRRNHVSDKQTSAKGLLEVINNVSKYDYIIEVMCTNPLKTVEDIDGVIHKLDASKADTVVSVVRIWDNHPSRVKHIENDLLIGLNPNEDPDIPGQRRQDLQPPAYVRNGSVYAMTYNQIISTGRRIGTITRPYEMDQSRTINIDEPRDLMLAKFIIENENK